MIGAGQRTSQFHPSAVFRVEFGRRRLFKNNGDVTRNGLAQFERIAADMDPALQADPSLLTQLYVGAAGGAQVPLSSVVRPGIGTAPLSVNHQGQFPAATISFNLAASVALGTATEAVERAAASLHMP